MSTLTHKATNKKTILSAWSVDDKCGFTCCLIGILIPANVIDLSRWFINHMMVGREEVSNKGGLTERQGGEAEPVLFVVSNTTTTRSICRPQFSVLAMSQGTDQCAKAMATKTI